MAVLDRSSVTRGGWKVVLDECGYTAQRERIATWGAEHIPESELPFITERGDYPDGCSPCGKATWWESRRLPDGRLQTRCTGCRSTLTFN